MTRKSIIPSILLALVPLFAASQPKMTLRQKKTAAENVSGDTLTVRARTQYTAQTPTPSEVNWKRDIYRELDLTREENAALYYPEEPLGDRVNFFTLLMNLILDGKISAYEYRLDGNELFTESNRLDVRNLLEKFYIYYEEKDGKYVVQPLDIPSNEVTKYYIKESNYLDQRTSEYQTRVTAVCPVLRRADVGDSYSQFPMFWVNYDEVSPYLGQVRAMTSSFNNVTNMSLDDYFVMRRYRGEIYKTSNLHNRPLAEYCANDTVLKEEQERIEQQLVDFESGLWASETPSSDGASAARPAVKVREKDAGEKAPAKASGISAAREQSGRVSVREDSKEKTVREKQVRTPVVRAPRQSGSRPASTDRVSVRRGH